MQAKIRLQFTDRLETCTTFKPRQEFHVITVPNNDQRPTTGDPRRAILGILAVFFMLGALGTWFWPPTQGAGLEWQAACWRFAPILAVLWIAYYDLKRIPWWLWLTLPFILIIIVKWPRYLLFSIPFLILFILLKLRIKGR